MDTREDCLAADACDPLAPCRERFSLPEGVIYLDGNSLGPLPRATPALLNRAVKEEWGRDLIGSWNKHGWISLPETLGDRLGALIGAGPGQVIVTDSTSVNLYKLLHAALTLRRQRRIVLSEEGNFPTDLYIAQGLENAELRLSSRAGLPAAIDESVAVVMLTQVDYRTGALWDMKSVTKAAHDAGALILWDLSHSAGALPVDLDGCDVDFAVGCGYKYLNGGPGAPAFLYIAERLQEDVRTPLSGWMGHAAPFDFGTAYAPAPGIRRMLCGTPSVLALRALEAGLASFTDIDMAAIRRKSLALSDLFMTLAEQRLPGDAFEIVTPREDRRRGSQVSIRHGGAYAFMQALIEDGVIGDFRSPDLMRFGFAPLYTRFVDVWDAVERMAAIAEDERWRQKRYHRRQAVT